MNIVKNFNPLKILIIVSLLISSAFTSADNNRVGVTAEINKGSCEFSTTAYSIVFESQMASAFTPGNAVAVKPLKLRFNCKGYPDNAKMGIIAMGSSSPDNLMFLSSSSTATGVGFMLKKGEVTETTGFYSAGTTVKQNDSERVDMVPDGEYPLSVGFIKQNKATPVTQGDASASIIFIFSLY